MEEKLMNPQDVSTYLGVPVVTLYGWRSRGDGPRAMRVGRHLRYRRSDIDKWLDGHSDPRSAAS